MFGSNVKILDQGSILYHLVGNISSNFLTGSVQFLRQNFMFPQSEKENLSKLKIIDENEKYFSSATVPAN